MVSTATRAALEKRGLVNSGPTGALK
jgi:hypothetical protein